MPWEREHRGIPLQFDETAGRLMLNDFERSVEYRKPALAAVDADYCRGTARSANLTPPRPPTKCRAMKRLARRRTRALPVMMADLLTASWETVARRTSMVAQGTCTPKEYQRMMLEKAAALKQSAIAVMTGRGKKAALAPWHKRATANARRLRRKS
jgi:hypothetical protein